MADDDAGAGLAIKLVQRRGDPEGVGLNTEGAHAGGSGGVAEVAMAGQFDRVAAGAAFGEVALEEVPSPDAAAETVDEEQRGAGLGARGKRQQALQGSQSRWLAAHDAVRGSLSLAARYPQYDGETNSGGARRRR